jgi:hypothetical protein
LKLCTSTNASTPDDLCLATHLLMWHLLERETSNNLLLFLLVSLQKSLLGLKFETQKRPVSPGYFKSLILVYLVRPKRRPKGDLFETKRRPNCD